MTDEWRMKSQSSAITLRERHRQVSLLRSSFCCITDCNLYRGVSLKQDYMEVTVRAAPILLTDLKYIPQDSLNSIVYEWGGLKHRECITDWDFLHFDSELAAVGAVRKTKAEYSTLSFVTLITVYQLASRHHCSATAINRAACLMTDCVQTD